MSPRLPRLSSLSISAMSAFVQRPAPVFKTTAVVGSVFQDISLTDFLGKWYAFTPLIRRMPFDTECKQGRVVLLPNVRCGEVSSRNDRTH